MENKHVGYIIISFAIILGLIIYLFNRAMTQIVTTSCDHGPTCPMWGSINFHTNLTIALMIIILLIGVYFIFYGNKLQIKQKKHQLKMPQNLNAEEKQIMQLIIKEEGTIFQSTLVDKTEFGKVKITRILDKLEGKGIINRKRRGMTNVVILNQED